MTHLDALLGTISKDGTALEQGSGLNFVGSGISVTRNPSTQKIDITGLGGDVGGPPSAVVGRIPILSSTSGKVIADGGLSFAQIGQGANVRHPSFGAVGNGSTDDSAAFAAAAAAAVSAGHKVVAVPDGNYNLPNFDLPSGVSLLAIGENVTISNCHLTVTGTVGSELAFTAAAAVGALSISIPATGLSGAWLRLVSCINSNSPNAGIDQLGDRAADYSYLAEFAQVAAGSVSTATLRRPTQFPYSNTSGSDSGSRTTSVARVVTFNTGSRIKGIKFIGKNASFGELIKATWCRDLIIEGCTLDANDLTSQNVNFEYCLDSHVRGGRNVGKLTSVPGGSPANQGIFISCQNCTFDRVAFEGGNQSCDVTYSVGSIYGGGPSIDCGATKCTASGYATDGFTSHPGCLRISFDDCTLFGGAVSANGIRIRSRGDRVKNCNISGLGNSGAGVLVMETALFDSDVSDNTIKGFGNSIEFQCASTSFASLRALLGGSQAQITKNRCYRPTSNCIALTDSPALATMIGPKVTENECHSPGTHGINVGAYVNGTIVDRNRIQNVPSTRAGVVYTQNVKRLRIGTNPTYGVDNSGSPGYAVRGSSTVNQITDTTTFPAGNAEAQLSIGPIETDATTPTTGIVEVAAAYVQQQHAGWVPNVADLGTAAPTLAQQTMSFHLSGANLIVTVKNGSGTTKSASIALT